jgi:glycosyltransferase involved in cell wall biosynthesis
MSSIGLISVVITTYNRSEALAQVLMGLSRQDDQNFEVIVADDGSSPAHRVAIGVAAEAAGLPVVHMWHPDVGFTASRVRNRGVSVANGDYIVFLDGDCIPEVDFIRRHRQLREAGYFVNGSRILLSESITTEVIAGRCLVVGQSLWFWIKKNWSGDAGKLNGVLRLPDFPLRQVRTFLWRGIRSCNMGVWRNDFEAVNGFDESFVGWGHEDADFVLRLHNLGLKRKNGFCATEVFHLWHQESSRLQAQENADRVEARRLTRQIQSTVGFLQSCDGAEMVVNRLR